MFGGYGVADPNRRRFCYCLMREQGVFDFKRADALCFAIYHVVIAGDKPEVTFRVAFSSVTKSFL